jgi:hypothetical protein
MGFTAPSRFLVRKSQNILGQKKPSTEAAIWSTDYVSRDIARECRETYKLTPSRQ